MVERILEDEIDPSTVQRLIQSLAVDGSWPTIDYTDKTRAKWPVLAHPTNVLDMARAWKAPRSPLHGNEALKEATLRALHFWLEKDLQNPNWFQNKIAVPKLLAQTMLLLELAMTEAQKTKALEIIARAKIGMTGQNLIWLSEITLCRAVLQNDPALARQAVDAIAKEIRITLDEGIQPDYSFHQHGPCLYNLGYGASYAADGARLITILRDTEFALADAKTGILTAYLLDGSQWMLYGSSREPGAMGRAISRPLSAERPMTLFQEAARDLLKIPTGREDELRAFATRCVSESNTPPLVGNRIFPKSDVMVHQRPTWYASARGYSNRIVNTDDPCNGEGLLNHYIADGCNYCMLDGAEYREIFPVWDWKKVPGTTVDPEFALTGTPRRKGSTDFAGGVSDGHYGVFAFHLARNELDVRKAWFFFDHEYVCLGAGIHPNAITTVNQCYLRGDVTIAGKPLARGTHALNGPITLHHDHIAYGFPKSSSLTLGVQAQTGNWHEISSSRSKDPITKDVFQLVLTHGENSTYAYTVCPGEKTDASIEILQNTKTVQAIYHRDLKIRAYVFYQPGSIEDHITVDQPCVVLIKDDAVFVADPTQLAKTVKVTLHGKAHAIDLPQGFAAGTTVKTRISQ